MQIFHKTWDQCSLLSCSARFCHRIYCNLLSLVGVTLDGGLECIIGFMDHLYTRLGATSDSGQLLIFTIHKSPQNPLSLFQPALSTPAVTWQWLLTVDILQPHSLKYSLNGGFLPTDSFSRRLPYRIDSVKSEPESECYVTTDSQSASLSLNKTPIWGYDQICITLRQLRVYWCGALSLPRGRVCRLQLLLVLASALILRFDSRWILDHTLLNWRLPFKSPLTTHRAAVEVFDPASWLPWLSSIQPLCTDRVENIVFNFSFIIACFFAARTCLPCHSLEMALVYFLNSLSLHSNGSTQYVFLNSYSRNGYRVASS
jgi:hypothetical protein